MATLLQKANEIKTEKDTYVIPGNIRSGVTIFGVQGNCGPGDIPDYLCFTANTAGSTIKISRDKWIYNLPPVVQYSVDGVTWNSFVLDSPNDVRPTVGTTLVLAHVGDKVYFRGDNAFFSDYYMKTKFVMTGSIAASGNIMSLVDKTCQSKVIPNDYCFYYTFYGCSALTSAPKLPATTLKQNCYEWLFHSCTNLTVVPELPATTMTKMCYENMFAYCSSLVTAPVLCSTSLAERCYGYMFDGCTSLTTVPKLPATVVPARGYMGMFRNCRNLETIPELPALELPASAYYMMFYGCSKIKISTTETSDYKYIYRIPSSGTGSVSGTEALSNMFTNTGGTFRSTPSINTTYYTTNIVTPAR